MRIPRSGRRYCIAALSAATIAFTTMPSAWAADTYPERTVEVIVPFAAGGAVDVTGRIVAKALTSALKESFVVINKPGANSNIGNNFVAQARPDGYTLLVSSIGLAANTALYKKLTYDPLTDLIPVSLVSTAPVGLFINKSVPADNLKEFIAYLKEHPGELNFASYGVGSSPHLAAEFFQNETGTKMVHVPFAGNGPATLATVSGTTQVIFCSTVAALPFLRDGALKPIAFADDTRSRELPDLPTFKEAGLEFTMGTWFGLLAPAKTPRAIIDKLHDALKKSLDDPEFNKIAASQGARLVVSSPEDFTSFLKAETDRLTKVIVASHIERR